MLNIGGVIVFDDAHWKSVNKANNYIRNYPSYVPYLPKKSCSDNNKRPDLFKARIDKYLRKPYIVPSGSLNYLLIKIKSSFVKHLCDTERNILISERYYAFQKISNDTRSCDWFENF